MKKVSLITVNYNQVEVTLELINSLKKQDFLDYELIVVDNGSSVDLRKLLAHANERVQIIRSPRNLGFAGGNNLGIRYASGDYLFFVNNDTEVPKGTIRRLVSSLELMPQFAIVSPLIFYFHDRRLAQYSGYTPINYITGRNRALGYKEEVKLKDTVTDTPYSHGAAMMVRRSAIDLAGQMPENYFLYYEELDWCEKIKEQGFKIAVDHGCYILHKESVSTGPASPLKTYFQTRNRILFIRRNQSILSRKIAFYCYMLFLAIPKNIMLMLLKGKWLHAEALVAGLVWNFRNNKNSTRIGYKFDGLRSS